MEVLPAGEGARCSIVDGRRLHLTVVPPGSLASSTPPCGPSARRSSRASVGAPGVKSSIVESERAGCRKFAPQDESIRWPRNGLGRLMTTGDSFSLGADSEFGSRGNWAAGTGDGGRPPPHSLRSSPSPGCCVTAAGSGSIERSRVSTRPSGSTPSPVARTRRRDRALRHLPALVPAPAGLLD